MFAALRAWLLATAAVTLPKEISNTMQLYRATDTACMILSKLARLCQIVYSNGMTAGAAMPWSYE
jgi:hypothetical protein